MAKKKDAIAVLKDDHDKVRKLLSDIEDTTEEDVDQREDLLMQLEREIKIHYQIEEEIFYPAFRDAAEERDERKMFFEATEEHHVVDLVLPEVKEADPASEVFAAKAKVLKELIEHHADEEEQEMFKAAREIMTAEELQDLGDQLRTRKEELLQEWTEESQDESPRARASSRSQSPSRQQPRSDGA